MKITKPTKVFLKKKWNISDNALYLMNNNIQPIKRSFTNSEDVWAILEFEMFEENNFFDAVKIDCNVENNDEPCYLTVGIYENINIFDNSSENQDIINFVKDIRKFELNDQAKEYFIDFNNDEIFFDKKLTKKKLFLKLEDKCKKMNGFYIFKRIDIILNEI